MNATPKANRRGFFTIAGMALAGGGIFYLTSTGGVSANPVTTPQAVAAQRVINQFLESGDADRSLVQSTLSSTQTLVARLTDYPNTPQVPLGQLKANPFRSQAAETVSADHTAAGQDRGDADRVTMLKSVEGLQLQSIVSSDNHEACMINNALFREGQQIGKFTIDKINENAVVIRGGDYRFELKIQR